MPNDPIRHVVLLMLENHSFDQMLGCYAGDPRGVDGVDPAHPHMNKDVRGKEFWQKETGEYQTKNDPLHEFKNVATQLQNGNSGFVLDFSEKYSGSSDEERQEIMGYYAKGKLPALHSLANDFTICDRWFSSLPGPTWPNRFFALSGTSSGQVKMPETLLQYLDPLVYFHQRQETIFDLLNGKQKKWKVYYYDFPNSWLLLRQLRPGNVKNYHHIARFFDQDVTDEKNFPDFVFIEPKYFGQDQNDDHPPHNIMKAEKLIADVYNAIRSNDPLWNSTLLIVTFDEHGGFYDHVQPPPAVPPDNNDPEKFSRLGVRVPALLISPWVGRRAEHTVFDHTSVLKYLIDKWNLGPAGRLGQRTAHANSIAVALTESQLRPDADTVQFIRVPYTDLIPHHPEWEKEDANDHQKAMQGFAHLLEKRTGDPRFKEAQRPPSLWTRMMKVTGQFFIRIGNAMTSGFEQHNKQRAERLTTLVKGLSQDGVTANLPELEPPPEPVVNS